jgi:hypothetical protein
MPSTFEHCKRASCIKSVKIPPGMFLPKGWICKEHRTELFDSVYDIVNDWARGRNAFGGNLASAASPA